MRTLKQINGEIASLQVEAERVRAKEKAEVIARIKEAIPYYNITAADLGLAGRSGRTKPTASSKKAPKAARANPVRYQDGSGNTWSGFGRKPKWFVEALASGQTAEALRVSTQEAS